MNNHYNGPSFPRTRKSRKYEFDGVGAYLPNSTKIPLVDAVLYVGGTALTVWATLRIAFWIWG